MHPPFDHGQGEEVLLIRHAWCRERNPIVRADSFDHALMGLPQVARAASVFPLVVKRQQGYDAHQRPHDAAIQLGHCFDLLDVRFTRELARSASRIIDTADELGLSLPRNQSASRRDYDWLKRHLDCFILNNSLPEIERTLQTSFDTVRGVFQEGEPAFKGAGLRLKSHIQIAVRNPTAIIGYFKPENL